MGVVTISAIKADVGGFVGHSAVHPELIDEASRRVREAIGDGLLIVFAADKCAPGAWNLPLYAIISFDRARQQALEMADYLRRNGPFEPGRLPMEDMEYTTMPAVAERLTERWGPIEEPAAVTA